MRDSVRIVVRASSPSGLEPDRDVDHRWPRIEATEGLGGSTHDLPATRARRTGELDRHQEAVLLPLDGYRDDAALDFDRPDHTRVEQSTDDGFGMRPTVMRRPLAFGQQAIAVGKGPHRDRLSLPRLKTADFDDRCTGACRAQRTMLHVTGAELLGEDGDVDELVEWAVAAHFEPLAGVAAVCGITAHDRVTGADQFDLGVVPDTRMRLQDQHSHLAHDAIP